MSNLKNFEIMLNAHLDGCFEESTPTVIQFNNEADKFRRVYSSLYTITDEEFIAVKKRVQEYRAMDITPGVVLAADDDEHEMWYTKRKEDSTAKNEYNDRFKKYLKTKKKWAERAVEKQDSNTDTIMDYLGDPAKLTPWARKGLIIGDVQAGKTVNYTSICNKAVDSGYKIIIVLAGVTNTLRKQTQLRLEKDFVGFSKSAIKIKGEVPQVMRVGVSSFGGVTQKVETFTSEDRDFSKVVADTISGTLESTKLFVVKKVKSVLSNLNRWFSNLAKSIGSSAIDVPMLLIDDESDNASVNTSDDEHSPTSINNGIRKILKLFRRNTYLGITATPFANILINPYVGNDNELDPDLFPKDFIYTLMSPPEYVGSEKIFEKDSEYGKKVLIEIKDEEMGKSFVYGHKKTLIVSELPASMKKAIMYFALTNAIRDHLGHSGTHRSMLMNVSRFVDVQNQLREAAFVFFKNTILSDLENYSKLKYTEAMKYPILQILKAIWDEYNLSEISGCEWTHVLKEHLFEANQNVKIMAINQKSVDKLDYENHPNGLRVIAVGGNCLSRGLTLEDLAVSYFYRNSQAYDTLMQMGRWFGYRPGYEDLVKLWISKDAAAWYRHISESTEALKREVYKMQRNNLTPIDFGLKIKGHPDVLIPTARNKMRHSKMDLAYEVDVEGRLIESPKLCTVSERLQENRKLLVDFISNLDEFGRKEKEELLWRDISPDKIAKLVREFNSLNWSWYFDADSLAEYIQSSDECWDVSIQTGEGKRTLSLNTGKNEISVRLQSRKIEVTNRKIYISGTKVRVGKGECAKTGLDPEYAKQLADRFRKENPDRKSKSVPDSVYLHANRNPILFIHFLDCNEESSDEVKKLPFEITALGLGFVSPEIYDPKRKPKKIKVYLNKIASEADLSNEEGDDDNVD